MNFKSTHFQRRESRNPVLEKDFRVNRGQPTLPEAQALQNKPRKKTAKFKSRGSHRLGLEQGGRGSILLQRVPHDLFRPVDRSVKVRAHVDFPTPASTKRERERERERRVEPRGEGRRIQSAGSVSRPNNVPSRQSLPRAGRGRPHSRMSSSSTSLLILNSPLETDLK